MLVCSRLYLCFSSVAGGVDRTECCSLKGMTGDCLDVCSGNITVQAAHLYDCKTHLKSFASCYGIPLGSTGESSFCRLQPVQLQLRRSMCIFANSMGKNISLLFLFNILWTSGRLGNHAGSQ